MLIRTVEAVWDTFEHEAFRLEALPQYLVEPEASMFSKCQTDGVLPNSHPDPQWLDIARRQAIPLSYELDLNPSAKLRLPKAKSV